MGLSLNMLLKDVDKGWDALLKGAAKLSARKGPVVDFGVSGGIDPEVLDYAGAHEFGTSTVPERSYIRATMDKNAPKYASLAKAVALAAQAAMLAASKSKTSAAEAWQTTAEKGLDKIGRQAVADVRARIESNIPPPLKPETIARKAAKGFAKPTIALIARGVLIKSITHKVRKSRSSDA